VRAVKRTGSGVELVECAEPTAGPSEQLVRVATAGICGSDLHMVAMGPSPATLGHEIAARTADGRLVAVRPTGACRTCRFCAAGRIHLCSDALGRFFGGAIDGGMADRLTVDADRLVEVPGSMKPSTVALVEPIAVAVHGVRRVPLVDGQRVAVIGAGSVGLAVVAALRGLQRRSWSHSGVDVSVEIDVEARHPHQAGAAERLGANLGLSGRYDVVFDAVGTQSAVDRAIRVCDNGGTVVELGIYWEPVSLAAEFTFREIGLAPAVLYAEGGHSGGGDDDFRSAVSILEADPEITLTMVTHRFPLADAVEAFRVAADRSSGSLKVQLVVEE